MKHMPILKGKDAEEYIKNDKKPLTKKQIAHLVKCRKMYNKNPAK